MCIVRKKKLSDLPDELLEICFSKLNLESLTSVRKTCHRFNGIVH